MIPLAFLLTANAISRDKAGWKIGLSFLPLLYYIICLLSRYCYFYKLKWLCEFNVYHFHSIESFGYLLGLVESVHAVDEQNVDIIGVQPLEAAVYRGEDIVF